MRAVRPNPVRWLWYALGGGLPDRYRQWVLYDLTCRTWVLRHLARAFVQQSVWWAALLLPGPWSLRISMVVLGYLVGIAFSFGFMEDASERRLIRHGYPPGLNRYIREHSQPAQRSELSAAYAAWYADRPRRGDHRE